MGTVSQLKKASLSPDPGDPGRPAGRTRASKAAVPKAPPAPSGRAGLEIYGLILTAFAILLLLSLVSFDPRDISLDHRLRSGPIQNLIGPVGAHIADLLYRVVGLGALFTCSTFFFFGGLLLAGRRPTVSGGGLIAYITVIVFGDVLAHVLLKSYRPFGHMPGGLVGAWVGEIARTLFATPGTLIIASSALGASVLRLSGLSMMELASSPARFGRYALIQFDRWRAERAVAKDEADREAALRHAEALRAAEAARPDPVLDAARALEAAQAAQAHAASQAQAAARALAAAQAGASSVPRVSIGEAPVVSNTSRVSESAPPDLRAPTAATPARPPMPVSPPALAPRPPSPASQPSADDGGGVIIRRPPGSAAPQPVDENGALIIEEMLPVALPPAFAEQERLPLDGPSLPYEYPSLSLLDYDPPKRTAVDKDALNVLAGTLEAKLADFGVKGNVVKIQPGPVVTMFEFLPAPGIKISKISALVDDLTMALEAKRVRIVAPIPGKGVVGIEIPSAVRETVFLKEILASRDFQESRGRLPICLGKDIVGNPVVTELAKAPHMLVAGTTGSGKSVAVNAFILSLVYRYKPTELRMILVDPKMLELSIYDDIPHLLLPVVTASDKAALALKWAVAEMERRYALLARCNVRNVVGFNQKIERLQAGVREFPDNIHEDELVHMPYIVIVLDELADLMMVSGKEVEHSIVRLAQMARACGIHLVVATQRPSADVITGLIKTNMPTRVAFTVSQKIDSRVILDRMGAENLLGQGDMLFSSPGGGAALQRIQGCFVSDAEVERVTNHLKKFGPPVYDMSILADDDDDEQKDLSKEKYDEKFDLAVQIVVETGNSSISYVQRRLGVGYNRAAKMIERMEYDGIISKADHRGVRKVLAPRLDPE